MQILPLLKDNPRYVKPNRLTQLEEELAVSGPKNLIKKKASIERKQFIKQVKKVQ